MKRSRIDVQYSTGSSRRTIEQALVAAGKDVHRLVPADLSPLEDFHTMGRIATTALVELAAVTSRDKVLDAGSGIGGTARFLADRYRCHVTAIDLTQEFCETARWLNRLVGLDDRISVRHGSIADLPFPDAAFTVVVSQHVQMNVADKTRLYEEAHRVLAVGGRLALWDITAGAPGRLDYPLPWADRPELSHLVGVEQLRSTIEAAGFAVEHWNDLTDDAGALMEALVSLPPNPLGLHAFVDNFAEKAAHLTRGLTSGRLRAVQGVAHTV
ncbi:MAG: class I SAM-dependent methyltransferase [Acidimicrobiales bacterium]|nr:class I SAM-dependent methyltransferase [Acidimicrobiales bacterium]